MPKNNEVQALVPEDALVLANPNGTAPGLAMKTDEDGRGNSDKLRFREHATKSVSRAGMENGGNRAPSSTFNPPASRSPQWLVMLPGPPRELRPMFDNFVVPLLRRVASPSLWCRKKLKRR
jgi:molybdopterin-biosynthesis enzyme MoeA-like protein